MKKLTLIFAAFAASMAAADCPTHAIFAGVGVSPAGTSGVAAYARRLACPALPIYSYSSVNVTGGLAAPAYTISSGAAIGLIDYRGVKVFGIGDLGLAQEVIAGGTAPKFSLDTLTGFAKAGGVLVKIAAPKQFRFPPGLGFAASGRFATGTGPTYAFGFVYSFEGVQ